MKIVGNNTDILTNTGDSQGFQINASGAAFRILSSGVYENKIKAIVRELGCNAFDSHVEAGIEKHIPFSVHIPNGFEPWFAVTDFGIGMSEEIVMNLYTTYFGSSKQGTNDLIGGLGIGSKSPFAYTDQFTVESTHDGIRTTYSAFIGADGTPQVVKIATGSTEAGNGVEVRVPVKPEDFAGFAREAAEVYQWFALHPHISGAPIVLKEHPEIHTTDKGYTFVRTNAPLSVLMGNVMYSVTDTSSLSQDSRYFLNSLVGSADGKLCLMAGIGDVSVSASRETLSQDKETVAVLDKMVAAVEASLVKDIQATLDKADSPYAVYEHPLRMYIRRYTSKFTFKGTPLEELQGQLKGIESGLRYFRNPRTYNTSKAVICSTSVISFDATKDRFAIVVTDTGGTHLRHNCTRILNERRRDRTQFLIIAPEAVQQVTDTLGATSYELMYLSKMVADGHTTPYKARAASAAGYNYQLHGALSSCIKKATLAEIKEELEGYNVFVQSCDMRSYESTYSPLEKKLKDSNAVIIATNSVVAKSLKKDGAADVSQVKFSDEAMKIAKDCICRETFRPENYSVRHALSSHADVIEKIFRNVQGIQEYVEASRLYHSEAGESHLVSLSDYDQVDQLKELKEYRASLKGVPYSCEQLESLEKIMKVRYPFISFKDIRWNSPAVVKEVKWYVSKKDEEIKRVTSIDKTAKVINQKEVA